MNTDSFPNRDDKEFGVKLRALRAARGWTQNELAMCCGCTQLSIVRWEHAKVAINKKSYNKLKAAFIVGEPDLKQFSDEQLAREMKSRGFKFHKTY